ncbi:uncharacterized protein LOC106130454 [Amyelois transitella]|uniref:uncharacterized protein LOC106130454 n=1 Tax=Amyelois transitella TaxID=680683 RepID=UPI00298FAB3B|nr:uncharacterized protein LOC106130454 [Amyelois transitella]
MPSKKRKYNARFPAGRIKKIMQTDEEVGKVAQAVPIIIPRTLELFVESLLTKAKQVTVARNAKTLSPSHVKQCILAESRFDFLKDLVKNIPDVSAAEEKEQISAESSPNSSRFSDTSAPRRIAREDSNSSSSCDVKIIPLLPDTRLPPSDTDPLRTATSTLVSTDLAIDLSKKTDQIPRPNFYQETLTDDLQHKSVITVNPTYSPQPSTSYTSLTLVEPKLEPKDTFYVEQYNNVPLTPVTPTASVAPILNIDFTKDFAKPEIKVLDTSVASIVGVKPDTQKKLLTHLSRQNSKGKDVKKEIKPLQAPTMSIDYLNSGDLQIDEDYDT